MNTVKGYLVIIKMGLLEGRKFFKPFEYEQFYERWKTHERSHWLPSEVPMHDDVNDWNNKLDETQKEFLTGLFRFFTQGDVDVAGAYCSEYLPNFCDTPEIAMFMASVAAREAVHIDAYSHLIETLGMPESTYREFLEYNEMKDKQEYLKSFQGRGDYEVLKDKSLGIKYSASAVLLLTALSYVFGTGEAWFATLLPLFLIVASRLHKRRLRLVKEHIACQIALFSGFTEGMQLFSSFAMLLSFPLKGLMKGMGQIVTWSIMDEKQHTEGMIELFRIFLAENSDCKCNIVLGCSCIRPKAVARQVLEIAHQMVRLEDEFINLAYGRFSDESNEFMGISKRRMKMYIRFVANMRMEAMGYTPPFFDVDEHPLPEIEKMINATANTNFFENRSTDYARGAGNWTTVWGSLQN